MDQKLTRYFTSLKEETDAALRGGSADVAEVINDISRICEDLVSDQDISFALAAVFDPDTGIFNMVERLLLSRDRAIQKGREGGLTFVAEFLKKTSMRAVPYAPFIKERCLIIFQREESKSIQAAALLPLISLFELWMQNNIDFDLHLEWTTMKVFLLEYRKAKSSGTLRANILIVLGYMAECLPMSFEEDNVVAVLNLCLDCLDEQLRQKGKDPVYVLVAGAMKCLDGLLTWFDRTLPAGGSVESARRVYAYLEQVIYFREDLKRYEMVKAGLRLLSRHACLFHIRLLEDSIIILKWLEAYCTHVNAQLRDAALSAFNEFVLQVATCLAFEDNRINNAQDKYKKLIAHALGILDAQDRSPKLVSLAIRMVGKLSPVIMKFSGKEVLQQAFQRIVSIGSRFQRVSELHEEQLGFSVTLVSAFADMIVILDDIDNYMVTIVAEAVGNIFYSFPYLFPKQKPPVYTTIQVLFKALHEKGAIFRVFLNNIAWSSLERAMEPIRADHGEIGTALWKNYAELWSKLLDLPDTLEDREQKKSHNEQDQDDTLATPAPAVANSEGVLKLELQEAVFDDLIKCVVKALRELNLKYRVKLVNPADKMSSDPSEDVEVAVLGPDSDKDPIEPLNALHMKKFLNLVEFVQELLLSHCVPFFEKWVYHFGRCLIELSSCYPLLSGFYKLLAVTIKIADEQGYFQLADVMVSVNRIDVDKEKVQRDSRGSIYSGRAQVSEGERALCRDLVQRFLQEVLIASRRYKLELLASCLRLCLSAPPALMNIASLVEPIKTALKMGLRYNPLAKMAMDALERWAAFCQSELEPYLAEIVPCFNNYLFISMITGSSDTDPKNPHQGSTTETFTLSQLQRIKREQAVAAQPDAFKLTQIRIQKFLGRIGRHAHFLVPDVNLLQVIGTGGLAWDMTDQVKFTLPFRDDKADISLDSLLPRIVELALSASDRSTKVVACEILHAICVLMVGNAAKGPARKRTGESPSVHYKNIYRNVFPAVIQLAADVEQVTRELFSRLVMQLIHWFTSNLQKENPDTMALLDSILEGLVNCENGSLREFCAECFEEFMRWSIRHTPPEVDNFVNVTSMLRRLYNRLDHPNPYHRLGASMACSRLYRVLRENKQIVDRHILEIIFFCIKSLRIAEMDHEQIGTVKQLSKVLDEFEKLVKRNISTLITRRKDRAMFLGIDEFLEWLFRQTVKIQEKCRSKCMWLFSSICEVLPVGSAAGWSKVSGRPRKLELNLKLFNTRLTFPVQANCRASIEEMQESMKHLSLSLHWLQWALKTDLITLEELALETKIACFMASTLEDFVRSLMNAQHSNVMRVLTPKEFEDHEGLCCRTVVYLLSFTNEIICTELAIKEQDVLHPAGHTPDNFKMDSVVAKFVPTSDPSFLQFLCLILLIPQELGFVHLQSQIGDTFVKLVMKVIKLLMLTSPTIKQKVMQSFQDLLLGAKPELDLGNFSFSYEGSESGPLGLEDARWLLRGYQQLLLAGILFPLLGKDRSCFIAERLLKMVFSIGRECPPALESFAAEILSLSVSLDVKVHNLLEHVFDQTPVSDSSSGGSKLTSGGLFYLNFRKVIIQQVKFSYKESLPLLLREAPENHTARLVVSAVLDDYIVARAEGNIITMGSFLNEFLNHLLYLKPCCKFEAPYNDKLFFVEVLHKLFMLDSDCETVLSPSQPSFQFIINSYFDFLGDSHIVESSASPSAVNKSTNLVVQNSALTLIPFFFKASCGQNLASCFTGALTKIVTTYLLVREADLPVGSNQRAMYIQTLDKVLEAVSSCRSVDLLEVLFPLFQNCTSIAKMRIITALEKYAQNVGDQRRSVCDMCLVLLEDDSKLPTLKRAVIELVFIPIICAAPSDFITAWYAEHIKHLLVAISKKTEEAQQSAENEEDYLTVKVCHYLIISCLFNNLDASPIKDKITPMVSNQQLMQITTNDCRGKNDPEVYQFSQNTVLWRDMHVQAYNCLAAIVMCTQEQEKIFTILFKDFAGKPLWQQLIDCNKVYNSFTVEISQLGSLQNVIRNLRSERKSDKRFDKVAPALASQYTIGATLSQEPTLIDSFIGGESQKSAVSHEIDKAQNDPEHAAEWIEMDIIDQDDFDQHPCLPVVLKIIFHLHVKAKESPKVPFPEMPEWMKALQTTLSYAGTPSNICLFILKVVTKARKIFAPFASHWIHPIVHVFLRDPENSGGRRFHYMLRDICITILEWNLPNPPDAFLASRFVNYLLEVAPHESNQVVRANLEIIRHFLCCWKDSVALDMSIISGFLNAGGKSPSSTDKITTTRRIVGLQLLGAMTSAGLPFYNAAYDSKLSGTDLIKALLSNICYKVKSVYEASAELLGMLLEQHKELQHEQYLEIPLRQILLRLFKEGEVGQFLSIMEKVTLHFPSFLEGYSSMIFDILPRVHGVFRIISLSIILRCPGAIPNLFTMLLPFLSKLLTHRDEIAQIKSLQLVMELVKDASKETISDHVLPVLYETFSTHESIECRKQYYQILINLYTTRKLEENELLKRSLLLGLCDSSNVIRESLQSFWHVELTKDPRQRFLQMIIQMYDPLIEDHWASTGSTLMLKLCGEAVDFKRPIFNTPLSECEFKEYTIDTSLLSGTLPMTPMFVDTQSTASQGQSQISEDSDASVSMHPGMIRATQQTLDDSLGQSYLSTYAQGDVESSLFAMSSRPVHRGFDAASEGTHPLFDTSTQIKRRLVHPSSSRPQILRNVFNTMKRREARIAQQALERANKVQIMRRYRIGDLPDIEIKHDEIIGPMVALAERDPTFSRLLLTILCRAIYAFPADEYLDPEHDLKALVTKGIEKALEKTVNNISFVSCVLSLCLENRDAWIKPKVVGSASKKSTNFQSGILFLENAILRDNAPWRYMGNSRKRHKGPQGHVTMEPQALEQAWVELAHLYRSIGENDVVLSIYKKHLTKADITHHALEAELEGDSARALQLYDKAIEQFDEVEGVLDSNPGIVEQDLWWTRRLQCMADLLDWRAVMNEILFQVGESNLQRLWEPRVQDSYLSLFIRAAIKIPTYHLMLSEFLQSASEDTFKKDLILNEFGTQVATLTVSNDQLDRSRFYIHDCYKSFIKHWTEFHPLATSARHLQVRELQKTLELSEFVDLSASNQHTDWPRLISEWRTRWPSTTMDDVEAWDDIVQNRLLFFQKLQSSFNKRLEKENEDDGRKFAFQLDEERASVYYEASRGLMKRGSYDAAKVFMNQFVALCDSRKEKIDFKSYKNIVKLRCLQANRVGRTDGNKAIQMLHQVLSYIESTARKRHQLNQFQWQNGLKLLEGNTYAQLGWLSVKLTPKPFAEVESMNTCLRFLGSAFDAYCCGLNELMDHGVEFSSHTVAKSSLRFSFFCDELLKCGESTRWGPQIQEAVQKGGSSTGLPAASVYPNLIVKHIMKAVQLNSSIQSHHGIARVLTLVGQHSDTHAEFKTAAKDIARWVFIPWIPQMLASMDNDEGELFVGILEDVATLYPQAIYYAFNVSKLDFGHVAYDRAKKLDAILKSPLLEGLVRGLEDLTFPEQRLRDGLAQVRNCLETGKRIKAKEVFLKIFEDCLDVESMMMKNRHSGEYNLKFAREYSKKVLDAVGQKGTRLLSMDEKQFTQATNALMANLQKALKTLQAGNLSLNSFSKWLADFDESRDKWSTQDDMMPEQHSDPATGMVDMFGSYTGFQQPDPNSHVKLVSFDQTLISLSSKQRPKVLKLRGSDELEYKFVVKGGEDLRLDQRIEQLFEVMNSILRRNSICSRRKLLVRTYAVIPVSKQCGLLQFVENTRPLDDVIKEGLACTLPSLGLTGKTSATDMISNLRLKYQEWLEKRGGAQNLADCYRNMYARAQFNEIADEMNSLISGMPWDSLRSGLFRLTTSAESFIALRAQYQRSLAVVSICGYVAGVGDRHLSNTLVDIKSGSLVPIDFGYSFGTGVILLPVPELIPFRLTHQLTNVLLPQDAVGLLRNDMIHVMTALRSSKDIISAVMDVFVKEPLVDWKTEAMKTSSWRNSGIQKNLGTAAVSEGDDLQATYEQQHVALKVEYAHRKLDLWNPADITVSELQSSLHANKPYMHDLEQIVRGDPDRNIRARVLGTICESVQEQIDCLIDQATDPNLLGRIWLGWQPWI